MELIGISQSYYIVLQSVSHTLQYFIMKPALGLQIYNLNGQLCDNFYFLNK